MSDSVNKEAAAHIKFEQIICLVHAFLKLSLCESQRVSERGWEEVADADSIWG